MCWVWVDEVRFGKVANNRLLVKGERDWECVPSLLLAIIVTVG